MDKKDATVFSIRKANGEVDGVVWALLDRANDGQEPVRISIARAIFDIGLAQPELVLSSLIVYVQKNSGKIAQPHRIILLNLLVRVLESAREKISGNKELGLHLVEFSTREMVATKEDQPDWQQPVSTALVLLSQHFCNEVIESILRCFKPGEMPHFFLVKTMADVAAAQGVQFTLRMRECLSRLIPVLSAVKAAPQKWVFAAALGRFAEAYTQFAANADEDSKKQVMPQTFAQDMCTAFDVILLHWLQHKEARVRFAVAESLGYMLATVDSKAFTERLSKLVPAYLLMYKNEPWNQHLPISHGFCSLLLAAGKENAQTLDPLYNTILQGLHPLVSRPPDMKQPSTMKNHNELLRCFEIIARANMDAVLVFLVGRFQLKDSFSRVGSLVVLRHLVNSMDSLLVDKKATIMSSVTTLVGEPDKQVKKAMMQLIVSMANQNYMQLDGGQTLVKFIVQQCAISPALIKQEEDARKAAKDNSNDGATNLQIRNAGNHILHVMTTKVPNTHPVLWPYLLEMINDSALHHAFLILIQCIHELAKLKRETKAADYAIQFEQKVNIPSPQTILSRLMIMGSVPFRQKGLGAAVINCMQSLGPIIHEGIGKYWDESMPALLEHLESQTEESFNLSKWQDTLLRLFKETIALAADKPQWLRDLAGALCEQFKQYKDDHQLHRVIHRYLGALLASVDDKKVINSSLETMLNTVNHGDDTERQGVSQGLGFCGSKHLDTVLPIITGRLDKINKTKSGGWFGGDAEAALADRQKSTLVLAYGYVTAYADSELILSRLDPHVLHNAIPVMAQAKTVELKTNIIKAVDLIGKSLHVSRLPENKQKYVLQQRDNLMNGVLAFLEEKNVPPPSNQLRMLGLNALSTLVNLEPPIKEPLRKKLLDTVLPFYALQSGPAPAAAGAGADEKDKKTAPATANPPAQAGDKESLEMVITNLNTLLSSLVHMEPNVTTLLSVLQRLEFWIVSKKAVERERSCATYMVLLKKFVHKMTHESVKQTEKALPHLGHYLATLLPRTTDSNLGIRQTAVENVQAVLYINQLLQNPDDRTPAQEIRLITELRNRMDADTVDKRLAVARDMAMLLTGIITVDELPQLLLAMLPGLCDPDVEAARGVAEVFAGLLSKRAGELLPKLEPIVKALVDQLKKITKAEVSRGLLQSFRILTRTHFLPVMAIMLKYPVPLAKEVVDCFVSLVNDVRAPADSPKAPAAAGAGAGAAAAGAGADAKEAKGDAKETGSGSGSGSGSSAKEAAEAEELAANTFKHLYLTCNETPFEKDKPCPPVQTATAALAEMIAVKEAKRMVGDLYAALFCTLLMRVGTAYGVDKGASSTDAVRALRVFLLAADDTRMVEAMDKEGAWKGLESKNYDDAVTTVTKIFCTDHVSHKRPILAFIGKYFTQQSYFGQRSVVTSLLAEFINHSKDDSDLLKELILFLLPRVADKNEKVRKQALRGLGNLVSVWNNEVSQSAAAVLSALTSASEDADAAVAAEAVSSLTKVAGVVDEYTMGSMLINICFRMRPAFDRADVSVRTAAFRLFGALCRFGKPNAGASSAAADGDIKIVERPMAGGFARESLVANFMDQLHTNVPIYLVHLNDDEEKVRAAALDGFRAITELMAPELHRVAEDAKRVDKDSFDDFVSRAAPLLAAKFADRLRGYTDAAVGYFGSPWQGVRGNAVMVAAHLMAATLPADRNKYSLSSVTANVLKMMSQENPAVRSRTAKALSLLHNI